MGFQMGTINSLKVCQNEWSLKVTDMQKLSIQPTMCSVICSTDLYRYQTDTVRVQVVKAVKVMVMVVTLVAPHPITFSLMHAPVFLLKVRCHNI